MSFNITLMILNYLRVIYTVRSSWSCISGAWSRLS